MEKFHLIDYYIKDLDPDQQRGIAGDVRDKFNYMEREYALDSKNNYENVTKRGLFRTVEDVEGFLHDTPDAFIAINNRMISQGRPPLFKDPYNLAECMEWRDMLLSYLPEGECNAIVGCTSFADYVPETYTEE